MEVAESKCRGATTSLLLGDGGTGDGDGSVACECDAFGTGRPVLGTKGG